MQLLTERVLLRVDNKDGVQSWSTLAIASDESKIYKYPRADPPTIFWTIGAARMGRIKSRLASVLVGSPGCENVRVVGYSPT
jgi:hypothetical protein